MGTPVDQYYTASDGTSMATPHVVSAAAIVAEQHPELTGQQIKALLMDTASDLGHDMYAQGTGLVDLATATNPQIVPKGNLNFGRLAYPHSAVTKKLTYTNRGDEATTLHLTMPVSFADGKPTAAGLFTLSTDKVVVPAGGSAEVSVTLDGRVLGTDGAYGGYNGLLSARDDAGAIRLSSGIHSFVEAQKFPLTLNVVPPAGATDVRYGATTFMPVDAQVHLHTGPVYATGADTVSAQLFRGTYAAQLSVSWRDAAGEWQQANPIAPEVGLTKPTTVTLDLRKAKPLSVQYPESTETYQALSSTNRTSATGVWAMAATFSADYKADEPNWWVLPTGKVSMGTLTHDFSSSRSTPVVTMRATGSGAASDLSARYVTPDATLTETQMWLNADGDPSFREAAMPVPRLPVKGHLPVVYAGDRVRRRTADVDARGKLVLLTPTDICQGSCDYVKLRDERVAAAAAAGAVGVLVAAPGLTSLGLPSTLDQCVDGPQSCPAVQSYAALPIVSVSYAEAEGLITRIKAPGRMSGSVSAAASCRGSTSPGTTRTGGSGRTRTGSRRTISTASTSISTGHGPERSTS